MRANRHSSSMNKGILVRYALCALIVLVFGYSFWINAAQ